MTTKQHLTVIEGGGTSTESDRGSEKWAKQIRKETKALASRLDEGYMELARQLYLIYDTPVDGDPKNPGIFTKWGYSSFAEYCDEELGIHPKKAQRLKSIWYNLEIRLKDRLDPEVKKRLIALGFSKVRELVTVLTARNAGTWLDRAEKLSYPKLCMATRKYREDRDLRIAEREVKEDWNASSPSAASEDSYEEGVEEGEEEEYEDQETGDEPKVPDYDAAAQTSQMYFQVYPEQRLIIDQALKRAAELSNSRVKSNNLHLICMDFLATNDFKKASRDQRLHYLAQLSKMLGFEAVLFEDGEVAYGIKTLEKAAKG